MPGLIIPLLVYTILSAGQPLTPAICLDSGGESWPVALTSDGKDLLGVMKNGDHCDVVVWDTTSKSKSFLVKSGVAVPLAVSPDRKSVAGMILTNVANERYDAEIVIWDIATGSTTVLLKLKKARFPCFWPVFACQAVRLLARFNPLRFRRRQYEEGSPLEARRDGRMEQSEDARFGPTRGCAEAHALGNQVQP